MRHVILRALLLAWIAGSVGSECPSQAEHGKEGLRLIGERKFAQAAECFWDAADSTEMDQEAETWLKNAGQAFEEAGMAQQAAGAYGDRMIVLERMQEQGKGIITVEMAMRVPQLLSGTSLSHGLLRWIPRFPGFPFSLSWDLCSQYTDRCTPQAPDPQILPATPDPNRQGRLSTTRHSSRGKRLPASSPPPPPCVRVGQAPSRSWAERKKRTLNGQSSPPPPGSRQSKQQ